MNDAQFGRGSRETATRRPAVRSTAAWAACAFATFVCAPVLLLAATGQQDTLIQVLFGDLPPTVELDANHDGMLTAADIVVFGPPSTPTPSYTASPTPTATATPTPEGVLFAGAVSDLIPHALGDRLVYRVTDPMGKITTETTNVISADAAGMFVVDDQQVDGQRVLKHETQSYNDTGTQLFFGGATDVVRDLRTTCSPPLLRLTMPVVAGQPYSTTIRCEVRIVSRDLFVGFIDRTDAFTPIDVVASLTVPAGTYLQVVHINGSTNLSGDLESDEIYLAPGVGPILQLSVAGGQTTRRELISGTIGGHPVTP